MTSTRYKVDRIQVPSSTVAGEQPPNTLAHGELWVNTADKTLYAGVDGGTPIAVSAKDDLFDLLSNGQQTGLVSEGHVLGWDGLKWTNMTPWSTASTWTSGVTYQSHELVEFRGELWRAKIKHSGHEPRLNDVHWEPVSFSIKEWQLGASYKSGDVLRVPWNASYFNSGVTSFYTGEVDPFNCTYWVVVADFNGATPAGPSEPIGIGSVPPGQFYKTNFGNVNTTTKDDSPGPVVDNDGGGTFAPFTPARIVAFRDYADLVSMRVPVMPGSVGITIDDWHMYEYTGVATTTDVNGWKSRGLIRNDWQPTDITQMNSRLQALETDMANTVNDLTALQAAHGSLQTAHNNLRSEYDAYVAAHP